MSVIHPRVAVALLALLFVAQVARGESGHAAWLRYPPIADALYRDVVRARSSHVVIDGPQTPVLRAAADELRRGLGGMTGRDVALADAAADGAIILRVEPAGGVAADGFAIRAEPGTRRTLIVGGSDRGALYGAFALLRRVQMQQPVDAPDVREAPAFALRMANTWDNPDGSVERGYGGGSLFKWDAPLPDPRHRDYARLLASVGVGAIAINNVNADPRYLTAPYLEKIAVVADTFRPYGVRLFLSVSFDSPRRLGKLTTADPLDPAVRGWWANAAAEAYRHVPDLGGFLIKADSEGQPGPYAYKRDHAEGANMLAAALAPHGGTLIWRAFVYGRGGDRLNMAYDTFKPLDGRFAENVVVQVKHGPLDFQIREPVHPLFGAMPLTNLMIEIQSSQEYTGQNVHLCYLAPMWREVFDFDTHATGPGSTVASVLRARPLQGVATVVNLGDDANWAGHDLAMANVYAAGRLSWDPALDPVEIAREWTRRTFGNDPVIVAGVASMLADSAAIYESYTSPLGLGVMHGAPEHFEPAPDIRHAYHRADGEAIGTDRSRGTGSGFTGRYASAVAEAYDAVATTPEPLLLYFHRLPYGHRMTDGRTLIQTLYDRYQTGARDAAKLGNRWRMLKQGIDAERHAAVAAKFDAQSRHAARWRDAVRLFLFQLSGAADAERRLRSDYRLHRRPTPVSP